VKILGENDTFYDRFPYTSSSGWADRPGVFEAGSHAGLSVPSGWCIGVDGVSESSGPGCWWNGRKALLGNHRAFSNGSPVLKIAG
jgi:hypothetical protein